VSEPWTPFDVTDADPDPFRQFDAWFNEARPLQRDPDAVVLATATPDGAPSARLVLLRYRDAESFGWYTNYDSRKGTELLANPRAALVWYAEALGRQVRIEGPVRQMSSAQSDAYFDARPRGHQIGALSSLQSRPLATRAELEELVADLTRSLDGTDVTRPGHWGGFVLRPSVFEFWQHRDDRLHDRVQYTRSETGWRRERLAP
jgi:pyridoxamine 5'-phosphate oxidase